MTKKLLFLVFSGDACRVQHAFMHALDLAEHGHQVCLLLEGEATAKLRELDGRFGELFRAALAENLVAGVCATAARGCSTGDPARHVAELAEELGLSLLGDLSGHASIERFVRDGYELVTF
ncbi:hypothetical protein ACFL5O_11015 [Myxococcota bacterium]